jgi:hypothetical protein
MLYWYFVRTKQIVLHSNFCTYSTNSFKQSDGFLDLKTISLLHKINSSASVNIPTRNGQSVSFFLKLLKALWKWSKISPSSLNGNASTKREQRLMLISPQIYVYYYFIVCVCVLPLLAYNYSKIIIIGHFQVVQFLFNFSILLP